MASASCSVHLLPSKTRQTPRTNDSGSKIQKTFWNTDVLQNSSVPKLISMKSKAAPHDRNTKPNSVICGDCDGNGAVLCSQCKGSGVNSVDLFDGQFKAGDSCWLCGGKKEMLCGNCNGAGFIGGFMSTWDQ
ncbi:hypothetical protein SLE2022_186300 [Rubroshorea leprosula]